MRVQRPARRRSFQEESRCRRRAVAGRWLLLVFALLGPLLAGHDPNLSDFAHGRGADGRLAGPSATHWLGVDPLFRDVFSRLAHGARVSLVVAFVATALSIAVGGAIGIVSGYTQGTRWQALDTASDALRRHRAELSVTWCW